MGMPTETIEAFLAKYGTETPGLMVGAFLRKAPAFKYSKEYSEYIAELMADLQSALETESRKAK